jgi:SAM-dependent methyltransferase
LDVGSGNGTWLAKVQTEIMARGNLKELRIDALDPHPTNSLETLCRERSIRLIESKIECAKFKPRFYDVINVTHSAYYFDDLCDALRNMGDALCDDGIIIITLVSQCCILNRLTEEIQREWGSVALNATTFLNQSCLFKTFHVLSAVIVDHDFDRDYFLSSEQNLLSLYCVLSRKLLDIVLGYEKLYRFRTFLENQESVNRQNTIFVLKKLCAHETLY